ncbi:MAG: MFS transporter [Dehalococcoidia bacterium]|nr:MFS transporter [Dehalococcoidia bacterium]MCB9483321.1 MFS transporter [Dehalococcoidia bacterium]MCB9492138.1 MFS transporter [Dehalococcoidia bacterium]
MSSSTANTSSEPGGQPKLRPWDAFRFRDYRFLWLAAFASTIAMWIRILGTTQWIEDDTGTAAALAIVGIIQLFVQIPSLLYGGALSDKIDRKRLMSAANAVSLLVLLGLGLLDAGGILQLWMVYAAIGITAAAQMMVNPARSALMPATVPRTHIMLGVTTDTASQSVAMIVGPLIFAYVASAFGLTTVFLVGSVVSALAMVAPLFIRAVGRAEGGSDGSTIARIREGFWFVVRHPILPGLFLLDTGNTVVSFYREILPALARGLFRSDAAGTGLLGAANSAGAVFGAIGALFFAGYRAKGMLVLYATLVYAIALFGFGSVNTLWMGMVMIAILGGADAITVAVRQTTVQLTTPDHMRGRAFSFMILAAQTANNIGTIWVGFWAAAIGPGNTMIMGGVIAILATLTVWRVWRPIREYRYP